MSPDEVQRLFAGLQYEWDGRNPPDNRRKGRFRNGWEDAVARGEEYSMETLQRLTWHNLGYRFGKILGLRTTEQIDEVYHTLAASYVRPGSAREGALANEENDKSCEMELYDWEAEVRDWCRRRRRVSPALTDSLISFFRLSFQNTQCADNAWFGCHASGVSLVIGGIYLAAAHRSGNDRGLWLVVDNSPPPIGGVDYRPVRSTQSSDHPLLWAHANPLEIIPEMVACPSLWLSFRSATTRIQSVSHSAASRDEVQQRRGKHRLSAFWKGCGHPLMAEDADDGPSYVDGYTPMSVDRRLLVERQICERRGQHEFRTALRQRYGDHCLVTGCPVLAVLEAAHISPYRGEDDNHPENGLLLRADIHTMFDLDLIGIEPKHLRVELHPDVAREYGQYAGSVLNCPVDQRPSQKALDGRYAQFRRRQNAAR